MDTERRYLFDKSDGYLFSFDVTHRMIQAGSGWNLDFGPRAQELKTSGFDVFNVRNDTVVNNREAVLGNVLSVVGRCDFRMAGDAACATGKMLLRTRDGVVIESVYYGTNRLQELGQRTLLTSKEPETIEVKLSYWLRFDTTSPKYRWLVQSPCVGFGRGVIKPYRPDGEPVATDEDGFPVAFAFDTQVDVYALA